ncbi:anthranilate synthase component I family protein [Tistrella bauzanensis]
MDIAPDFDHFAAIYGENRAQVVSTTLAADLETPVSAMLKLADRRPYSFLLESVEGGAVRGRYSLIGLKPDVIWRVVDGRVEINRDARADLDGFVVEDGADPIASLRALIAESRIDLPAGLPPMAAGLVGYLGYDMVRFMERLPEPRRDALGIPDAIFTRPTVMAIFDAVDSTVTLITPVRPEPGCTAAMAWRLARERLMDVVSDLGRGLPVGLAPSAADLAPRPSRCRMSARRGSRTWSVPQGLHPGRRRFPDRAVAALHPALPAAALRLLSGAAPAEPSPFLFYLDYGHFQVAGSSPEILVRVRDDVITVRPIAGTRRRGKDAVEDQALAEELAADPKEVAEHLMLLDLARNDVGRFARIGTVKVTENMIIERYSAVMHLVSNVEGDLAPAHDALDALIGGFPAGTVSGAPKVRAMEIINELEPDRRGVYGGGVGYFSAGGAMDSCIVLRTAVIKDGELHVQAGAGVVADSDPTSEYEETRAKARALIRAAGEAWRYAGGLAR